MREIDRIIESNEKVLWEGVPNFWPFILGGAAVPIIISLFFFGGIFTFYMTTQEMSSNISKINVAFPEIYAPASQTDGFSLFSLIPIFLTISGLAVFILPVLYKILVYRFTHYAITNKRVIIQTGIIGRDFKFIDFDQITNASVNVGIFDKMFGNSGSIILASAGTVSEEETYRSDIARFQSLFSTPYTLKNIFSPYNVFKFFKKTSFDVKTDVQYPNKYRPKSNPGYRTKYNAKI